MSGLVGLPKGSVALAPHRPEWAALFEEEASRLRSLMGAAALSVEHVGSTSVEGLDAKPIIDLMVGVRNLEEARAWVPGIEALGYEFRPKDDIPARIFFAKGPTTLRTHHLSLAESSSDYYQDHLRFRDHLRAHATAREEYRTLKQRLAREFPCDRAAYTEGKAAFIRQTVEAARRGAAAL